MIPQNGRIFQKVKNEIMSGAPNSADPSRLVTNSVSFALQEVLARNVFRNLESMEWAIAEAAGGAASASSELGGETASVCKSVLLGVLRAGKLEIWDREQAVFQVSRSIHWQVRRDGGNLESAFQGLLEGALQAAEDLQVEAGDDLQDAVKRAWSLSEGKGLQDLRIA